MVYIYKDLIVYFMYQLLKYQIVKGVKDPFFNQKFKNALLQLKFQATPSGKRKIVDLIDCSGSGDVDTSTVVTVNEDDGCIIGKTGRKLRVSNDFYLQKLLSQKLLYASIYYMKPAACETVLHSTLIIFDII